MPVLYFVVNVFKAYSTLGNDINGTKSTQEISSKFV